MHHISLFGAESNLRNPDAALNYDLHVLGSHIKAVTTRSNNFRNCGDHTHLVGAPTGTGLPGSRRTA